MTTNYFADELRQIIADLVTPGTGRELARERLQRLTEYVERFVEPITGELEALATGLDAEQEIRALALDLAVKVVGSPTLTAAGRLHPRVLELFDQIVPLIRDGSKPDG
jgi:hypothetical protein